MSQEQEAAGGSRVRVERRGRVEMWVLDRPDRMNAFDRATVRRIGELAREAAAAESVRVVVVTGAGGRAFCAGADLKERRAMSEDGVRAFLDLLKASLGALDRMPKPVVAAINGLALGGGLEIALACDLRVMAPGAEVGLTEVSLGVIPGAGGTQRLARVVGEARAKELILLSRRISAERALALGLVHEVAPAGRDLIDFTLEWVAPLIDGAPIAMAAALEAIDAASGRPLEEGLQVERACYERVLPSEDRLEALAAFAEKRKPAFKGR